MNLLQNLIDEVKWRRITGMIDKIDADTIIDTVADIYPNMSDEEGGKLVFQAMVKLQG